LAHGISKRSLELAFALPPGCYATTLLRELGDVVDSAAA
jgi:tRNA pseudouridine13 synthase